MLLDRNEARADVAKLPRRAGGFTLIELLVVVTLVGILGAIAFPTYRNYIVRGSRSAAQTELIQLSSMQEKIYLNDNGYTNSVNTAYNGHTGGGLGKATSKTDDGKYTLDFPAFTAQSYTLRATPVAGSTQVNDGSFWISSDGSRGCAGGTNTTWCVGSPPAAAGTW